MRNFKKHNTKTHLFFLIKKPSPLIRVIRNKKNLPKEKRERETVLTFFFLVGKIWIEWEK